MWLGQAVGAQQLTTEHARQPPLALLVGSRGDEGEACQRVHTQAETNREPRPRQLLDDAQIVPVGLAAAAPSFRIGQPEQSRPPEQAERLARERRVPLGRVHGRAQLLVGQFADQVQQFLHHPSTLFTRPLCSPVHSVHPSTTTRSLVTLLSRSQPSAVQTTMSSILAPCGPG